MAGQGNFSIPGQETKEGAGRERSTMPVKIKEKKDITGQRAQLPCMRGEAAPGGPPPLGLGQQRWKMGLVSNNSGI